MGCPWKGLQKEGNRRHREKEAWTPQGGGGTWAIGTTRESTPPRGRRGTWGGMGERGRCLAPLDHAHGTPLSGPLRRGSPFAAPPRRSRRPRVAVSHSPAAMERNAPLPSQRPFPTPPASDHDPRGSPSSQRREAALPPPPLQRTTRQTKAGESGTHLPRSLAHTRPEGCPSFASSTGRCRGVGRPFLLRVLRRPVEDKAAWGWQRAFEGPPTPRSVAPAVSTRWGNTTRVSWAPPATTRWLGWEWGHGTSFALRCVAAEGQQRYPQEGERWTPPHVPLWSRPPPLGHSPVQKGTLHEWGWEGMAMGSEKGHSPVCPCRRSGHAVGPPPFPRPSGLRCLGQQRFRSSCGALLLFVLLVGGDAPCGWERRGGPPPSMRTMRRRRGRRPPSPLPPRLLRRGRRRGSTPAGPPEPRAGLPPATAPHPPRPSPSSSCSSMWNEGGPRRVAPARVPWAG